MTRLPHQSDLRFLTWVGMETDLIFNQGIDLPEFASFPLLEQQDTRAMIANYANRQVAAATQAGFGTILETATWVANADRAAPLGYDASDLERVNRDAVDLLVQVRKELGAPNILISANLGPRGDAYAPGDVMSSTEAQNYHSAQIQYLADAQVDLVSAYTFSNADEAIGVVRATQHARLPCVVAFTVETDGRLPSGQTLDDAIAKVDQATDSGPIYYMINCAHPSHFARTLNGNARLMGLVVNASSCSHAELDVATELDDGDPDTLGQEVADLFRIHPGLRVFGGCCGTDLRHITAMAARIGGQP